ncbi:TetR family transcriptional regulator [Williamsia sp. Leaf354]|uniref:TetR/AcrR family transcriptional regulator n=1 Tax=Williamsia sp. Leaf354 TaxID=1736349 RepID=UPI0006FB9868|nr:TetR/AcrR family transcriptional regulator [Williamsia sp. Leaf354]KQS01011.1 TetR family transcriptional regulator [Williamsia sp. Leaf354]
MTTADQVRTERTEARPLRADAERNRLRIIAAARDLFAQRGLEVTLDDVAAHAGVGVGTVYRRFDNRDQLIEGVFVEHLHEVATRLTAALESPDTWNGVVTLFTYVGESMAGDRGLASVMMRIDHTAPAIETAKLSMTSLIEQVHQRGVAEGVLRPEIERTDFFAFFTMLSSIAEVTESTAPGTWRRYLELMLDSIRADGTRHPLTVPAMTDEQIRAAQAARCRTR